MRKGDLTAVGAVEEFEGVGGRGIDRVALAQRRHVVGQIFDVHRNRAPGQGLFAEGEPGVDEVVARGFLGNSCFDRQRQAVRTDERGRGDGWAGDLVGPPQGERDGDLFGQRPRGGEHGVERDADQRAGRHDGVIGLGAEARGELGGRGPLLAQHQRRALCVALHGFAVASVSGGDAGGLAQFLRLGLDLVGHLAAGQHGAVADGGLQDEFGVLTEQDAEGD